jgi:hypothetical protein
MPMPGEEVHWPGIHHIAEKIVDECFGQLGDQNDMGFAAVHARQWTRLLDPKIAEEMVIVNIYKFGKPSDEASSAAKSGSNMIS